jgi:TP53 regulating kinase-like protein
MWLEERQLHLGAEAVVSSGLWMGRDAVLKVRQPRLWRHPDLDQRLTASRISVEIRLLHRLAQRGFAVPRLLAADVDAGWIVMTRATGRPLIEVLRDSESELIDSVLAAAGETIRALHAQGIAHGDLTTNNMLWDAEEGICLIDFGLGRIDSGVEKLGLDLQVLSECLSASHPEHAAAMDSVLAGYQRNRDRQKPAADEVVQRLQTIRARVRYHT